MGAINFFTSDYITLAIKPYETDDFMNDSEFMEEAQARIESETGKYAAFYLEVK